MRTPPITKRAAAAEPAEEAVAMRISAPLYAMDTIVLPSLRSTQRLGVQTAQPIRAPWLARTGNGKSVYPIGNTLTIGRMPSNNVVLDDPKASRRHAEIVLHDGEPAIRDLQSANGTLLNGEPVTEDRPLHNGDTVTIGDAGFVFHNDLEVARPRLVMAGGGGAEHLLKGMATIGRSPANDITIHDPKASRHHAEIGIQAGQVVVRDLASLNGTKVNGEPIVGEYALSEGDTITIGDVSFVYHNDFAAVSS
jgi:pSer/pThr/pTyr-binding forkhead associated (FHA) protein